MNAPVTISPFTCRSTLTAIILGAALVRVWGLWDYMPTMDEVQFFIIAQGGSIAELWQRARAEVHPPLVWIARRYLLMLTDDFFVHRLFAVTAGVLTVYGTYFLGKALFRNRSAALLTAFLMAFIPSSVIASMSLRNYAFLMLFAVWGLMFFVRWFNYYKPHNLLLFIIFIASASASHFSGFLIAAACGLGAGVVLLWGKQWQKLALLCVAYIPIAALGIFFYLHYLAPGTTIPMWKHFMLETGYTPKNPETGIIPQLVIPLIAYFSPFLQAVHKGEMVSEAWIPLAQMLVLLGSIVLLALYALGIMKLKKLSPIGFALVLALWAIAIPLSVLGVYPLSANRHNVFMLPFFILPLVALLIPITTKLLTSSYRTPALVALITTCIFINQTVIWHDPDFCLKNGEYQQGQEFLHNHLAKGDAIVTGPMGAYFYLIYAYDMGKTPYHDYTDKPYFNESTLLAPFGSPYKPYNSWRQFRDNLQNRLNDGSVNTDANIWFVQYGWKNQEVWMLMQCNIAKPLMQNFMSRDGVAIFSIKVSALTEFLKDHEAWEICYKNYKPLVIGTPFKQQTSIP